MLVSAVMPIMSIYRLPFGQYGYTGHVVNLPQDVVSFANSLPRVPSELDVLVVRKDREQSHRDFRVRRSVVQEALTWLLENRYFNYLSIYNHSFIYFFLSLNLNYQSSSQTDTI